MMIMSLENTPMKLYRAIYRENNQTERKLDLYAPSCPVPPFPQPS